MNYPAATVTGVPPRRGLTTNPCNYLSASGPWPDGPLADDAPDEARFALEVRQRLKAHCDANGLSMNAVSRATNVYTQTIINFLAGRTWGDLPIIYRLQAGLGVRLWANCDPSRLRVRQKSSRVVCAREPCVTLGNHTDRSRDLTRGGP